jgi:CheY-like chemotaxis protein
MIRELDVDWACKPSRDPELSLGARTRGVTVLLVDDYEDTRLAYATEAEAAGFHVELAGDGYDALAKALVTLPDVVVAEAMLYGLDGFELTDRMTRNPRTRGIPVVLLTGFVMPNLAAKARDVGCAALLTKPCPFDVLERTILRALRGGPRVHEHQHA